MKIILLMVLCSTFVGNTAFANIDQMSYNIRRMADAMEKQNRIMCSQPKMIMTKECREIRK